MVTSSLSSSRPKLASVAVPLAGVGAGGFLLLLVVLTRGPALPIAAVVALAAGVATLRSRTLALATYLVLFFAGPIINPVLGAVLPLTAAKLFAGVLFFHLARLVAQGTATSLNNYPLFGMVLLLWLSLAAFEGVAWSYNFQVLLVGFSTYLFFRYLVHTEGDFEKVLTILPAVLGLVVLVQLQEGAASLAWDPNDQDMGTGIMAGMHTPTKVARVAAAMFPLCLFLAFDSRRPRTLRLSFLALGALQVLAVLWMVARAPIIGSVFGVGFLAFSYRSKRAIGLLAGCVILTALAWTLVPSSLTEYHVARWSYVDRGTQAGDQNRVILLQRAFEILKEFPLLGVGPDNSPAVIVRGVHNTYVQAFLEGGMLGGSLFLLTVWVTFRHLRRARINFLRSARPHLANWTLYLTMSVLIWTIVSVFNHLLLDKLWYVFFGLAAAAYDVSRRGLIARNHAGPAEAAA